MAVADDMHAPAFPARRRAWPYRLAALLTLGLTGALPGWACNHAQCTEPEQDDNPCTVDACDNGTQVHEYLGDGHPCFRGKLQGACDAGTCKIHCSTWKDCDDGNPCTLNECQGDTCVIANNDHASPPSDGNDCTHDSCLGGDTFYWPMPEGDPCADGNGTCVNGVCNKCATKADCGLDDECRTWACEQGACIAMDSPKGAPVFEGSVNGDCLERVCDGHGGMVNIQDPLDVPWSGDECFKWSCNGWTPERKAAIHDDCTMTNGKLGKCSELGTCIQCIFDTDCPEWGMRCDAGTCITCGDTAPDGTELCGGVCAQCKGAACNDDTECASGHCALTNTFPARVCCDKPCDGICEQCDTTGVCELVPFGSQDETCSGPDVGCAGTSCKLKKGQPCQSNLECLSGTCSGLTKTCT